MTSTKNWPNIEQFDSEETSVKKFVFTKDDAVVESVLYAYPDYLTRTVTCCSVQSGCPVGCTFCGTGKYFVRNLTVNEVLEQVEYSLSMTGQDPHKIDKLQIMFMSMGEPMLTPNIMEQVLEELHYRYPDAALLVSTSGPDVDYQWLFDQASRIPNIGLQFSVHESLDEERSKLIPFKAKLDLQGIAKKGEEFYAATGRTPFFNYCTHTGNDTNEDAQRLSEVFKPETWQATVSVICEKDITKGRDTEAWKVATSFSEKLLNSGYGVRVFDPAGQDDIGGGCGQLHFVQQWMENNPDKARKSSGCKQKEDVQ